MEKVPVAEKQLAESQTAVDLSSSVEEAKPDLSSSTTERSLSSDEQAKISRILSACQDHDLKALSELACSDGGFIIDEVRRTACKQTVTWVSFSWPVV